MDSPLSEPPSEDAAQSGFATPEVEMPSEVEDSASALAQREFDNENTERPEPSKPHLQRSEDKPQSPRVPIKPATPEQISSAIGQAIEEVYRITEVLKHVLEDLDELLETLELAERQKLEDERELDNLRRALRQLTQRPQQQQSPRQQQPPPRGPHRHPERPQERHRAAANPPPLPAREATEQLPEDDAVPPQS